MITPWISASAHRRISIQNCHIWNFQIRITPVRKSSSTLISSLNDKSHEISTSWSLCSGSRGKRSRDHWSKSDLCLFFKLRPFRTFRKVDILPNLSAQSSHNLNNFHLFPSELQIYKIGEQQSFKILHKKEAQKRAMSEVSQQLMENLIWSALNLAKVFSGESITSIQMKWLPWSMFLFF